MKKAVKFLSLVMVLMFIMSSLAVSASAAEFWDYYPAYEEPFYDFGDVDLNGSITVKDATALQKHLAKIITLSEDALYYADVDGNEKATIGDATCIQKYVAKIIDVFPVELYVPDYAYIADGSVLDVELTADSAEEIMVTVEEEGYYNITAVVNNETEIYFDFCSEDLENHWVARFDGEAYSIYTKLQPGVYYAYMCIEIGEETAVEFSVTAAEAPDFNLDYATELNIGDRIDIKAGTNTLVYKVDIETLTILEDQLCVFTEGENPLVNLVCYTADYEISEEGYDDGTGNTILDIYDDGVNTEYYVVVTQDEGGSDFTLCCDTYFGILRNESTVVEVGTADEIIVEAFVDEYEGETYTTYIAQPVHRFTPAKSGYYSFNYETSSAAVLMAAIVDINDLEGAYILVDECDEAGRLYDVLYLEEGIEYFITGVIELQEEGVVNFTVLESNEEEYLEALEKNNGTESTYDEIQYTEIEIGDTVTVEFAATDDEFITENFSFTAEEDCTIVIYSEGSEDACVYILDESDMILHMSDDIATLLASGDLYESLDFAAIGTVSKGETVYFCLATNSYDADSFTFTVVNEADYTPIE